MQIIRGNNELPTGISRTKIGHSGNIFIQSLTWHSTKSWLIHKHPYCNVIWIMKESQSKWDSITIFYLNYIAIGFGLLLTLGSAVYLSFSRWLCGKFQVVIAGFLTYQHDQTFNNLLWITFLQIELRTLLEQVMINNQGSSLVEVVQVYQFKTLVD